MEATLEKIRQLSTRNVHDEVCHRMWKGAIPGNHVPTQDQQEVHVLVPHGSTVENATVIRFT